MQAARKFKDGDFVTAGYKNPKFVVVSAVLCVGGWRYKLAFPKQDGTPDRRMSNRHFFEEEIKPI